VINLVGGDVHSCIDEKRLIARLCCVFGMVMWVFYQLNVYAIIPLWFTAIPKNAVLLVWRPCNAHASKASTFKSIVACLRLMITKAHLDIACVKQAALNAR
jgi:hypothetical protein